MSLKDFQTYLRPETKNAKIGFYQKPTAAFPNGRVLEADFSRPDIDATSGATVHDKDGSLIELTENQPDWSFPLDGGCPRLLMRPQAENLFLNSETLATQDVTATAEAYTVSFKGTGTIAFSGAHTGSLAGTGAEDIVSVTFTPTVGTVTCTVSGSVLEANFILGPLVSTWIPTGANTVTRSANSFEFTDLITKGVYSTSGSFAIKADFTRGTYTTDNTLLDLGTNNGIEISDYPDDNLSLVIKHAGTIIKRFNIPAGNNAFIFSWSPSGWKLFNSSSATPLDSGAEAIAVENNFNVYGRLYPVDIETIFFAPIALDNAQGATAWTELGQSGANALTPLSLYEAEYQAVLDYADAQGYTLPSVGQRIIQNKLLLDLKISGAWAKLDSFRVYATDGDANFALIDWKRMVTCTAVNSPIFTTNVGYRGDAVSARINTGYNPSVDAINLSLNNASMFMYRTAIRTAGQVQAYEGTFKAGEGHLLTAGAAPTIGENYINSSVGIANGDNGGIGFQLVTRPDASTINLYFNGTLIDTAAAPSVSLPTVQVWDFAANNGSVGLFFSDVGHAVKGIGADLTTEQSDLNTAIQEYIAAL